MVVKASQVRSGMRVLDLASGTGEPCLELARVVGPGGQVVATDIAREPLAVAAVTAAVRGITNLAFKQADALALPFEDASFDVVTCRLGVMYFSEPMRALRESRRVLKTGGRAAFLAWGLSERNPYFAIPAAAAGSLLGLPILRHDRFGRTGALSTLFQQSGFCQVREESHALKLVFGGGPEVVWDAIRDNQPTLRHLARVVPPERFAAIQRACVEATRRYWDGVAVRFPAEVVVVVGQRGVPHGS